MDRLSTIHSSVASLPTVTVTFLIGPTNSGTSATKKKYINFPGACLLPCYHFYIEPSNYLLKTFTLECFGVNVVNDKLLILQVTGKRKLPSPEPPPFKENTERFSIGESEGREIQSVTLNWQMESSAFTQQKKTNYEFVFKKFNGRMTEEET